MGMTPGEQELAELESYRTRDQGIREAKEKQLAELLLARLEEMHLTISSDEEKSSAIFGAIVTYMKYLGVKTKLGDSKKSKSNFFRKKISGRKADELQAKARKGFSLPGAALWGRDAHNADFRQSKVPETEKGPHSEKKGPKTGERTDGGAGAAPGGGSWVPRPPQHGRHPPTPPPGEGAEGDPGSDPPGPSELGDPPPRGASAPPSPLPASSTPRRGAREREAAGALGALGEPAPGRAESAPDAPHGAPAATSTCGAAAPPGAGDRAPPPASDPRSLEPGGPGGGEPPQSFLLPSLRRLSRAWRSWSWSRRPGGSSPPPHALLRLKKSEVKRARSHQRAVPDGARPCAHAARPARGLLPAHAARGLLFDEQELSNIFPSLEDLVEVHTLFLDSLKKLREESSYVIAEIGDVLLARFEGTEGSWFQKISARFCSRQSFALEQLKAKQRKDTRFSQFIQEAESQPRCRRLQLKDIIPTEMQRLTKYPLLLHNITKCTEAAGERAKVEQAAECCRQILNHVNQEVRDMENLMKLKDYQRRLDLSNLKQSTDPLLSEFKNTDITKRNLVHEGPLTWRVTRDKAVDVHVLLLDDLLVLLQRQEERLVLRCHSRTITPAPDGKQMLRPHHQAQLRHDPRGRHRPQGLLRHHQLGERGPDLRAGGTDGVGEEELVCHDQRDSRIPQAAGGPTGPRRRGGGRAPTAPSSDSYREPLLSSSENGGSLKEPLPLDEREKDGAVEGTEFEGSPEKRGAERALAELLALRRPPRPGDEGGLAAAALRRVSALKQLLPPPPPGEGDGAAAPPRGRLGGPRAGPPRGGAAGCGRRGREARARAGGQRPEGGAAGGPPNGPCPPPWGSRPAEAGGPPPPLALPPPQAAWLGEELQGLEETLQRLKEIEEQFWQLQQLLAKRSGCLFT
ncbi:unnamed protein product [Bubo scandiacus]